jgi:hypothetical protein
LEGCSSPVPETSVLICQVFRMNPFANRNFHFHFYPSPSPPTQTMNNFHTPIFQSHFLGDSFFLSLLTLLLLLLMRRREEIDRMLCFCVKIYLLV